VDHGDAPAPLRVATDGARFRVRTAQFATPWRPDTSSERHLTLVWLRVLVEAHGKPLFPLQEFAVIVGRTNRQAASQPLEDCRQCGEERRACGRRKRQVDSPVVAGVFPELLQTPLAGPPEVGPRVQARWGRDEVTRAKVEGALAQLSCVPVRRTLRRQLETGPVHSHEAWRLTAWLAHRSLPGRQRAGTGPAPIGGYRSPTPRHARRGCLARCAGWRSC
jgi:hypothetical protein